MSTPTLAELPLPAAFVGMLDSGIGGLSVLREVRRALPHLPIVYYADQAHFPYGPQPAQALHGYVSAIARWMIGHGARLIALPCHSASAASLMLLREMLPETPFVGLEPAVKPAAQASRTGVIGVLTTQVTASGALYRGVVERFAGDVRVITQIAPALVELAEHGDPSSPEGAAIIRDSLAPIHAAGADQIVLACTHFPFLEAAIRAQTHAALVDPAGGVARQIGRLTADIAFPPGDVLYLTSGDPAHFTAQITRLLGDAAPRVFAAPALT